MSDPLLLDTHIALWLDSGDQRLASSTKDRIDRAWHAGDAICLSAVSVWEIALLVDSGRIELDVAVDAWIERFLNRPGVTAVPLDHRAASRAYDLRGLDNRDPADRLLIATAIELGCPLVTYDKRIAAFAARHGRRCGFAALG